LENCGKIANCASACVFKKNLSVVSGYKVFLFLWFDFYWLTKFVLSRVTSMVKNRQNVLALL
jgi:hypothetical protein